jgi:hypothetical protein
MKTYIVVNTHDAKKKRTKHIRRHEKTLMRYR